jgi:endonuclease-3
VVLNTAFGEPTIAVDTHIFRVANRTGLAPGKTPRAVEEALLATTPAPFRRDAHHWLILHGRYVCKARRPDCPHCVIRDLCEYPDKTPDTAPARTSSRPSPSASPKASGKTPGRTRSRLSARSPD